MSEPIDNRLESLHASCQGPARIWLHIVTQDLGLSVRIEETLRSKARQAEMLATGKSHVSVGWHNVGLALDFGIFADGGATYIKDGTDPRYLKCGLIAEALGFVWGGRWSDPDFDHIEFHPGFTLQQFLSGQGSGLIR